MGFQDDISFKAAKKHKNINQAISFIFEQQTTATSYQERMNKIFEIKQNDNIYDIICRIYL